jgi:hypothetical protein
MKVFVRILFVIILQQATNLCQAQSPERDYLLTEPIYNDTFAVINSKTEDSISSRLMGKSLNVWLADSFLTRYDMRDFTLPLGVFKQEDSVNYTRGMLQLWKAKAYFIKSRSAQMQTDIFLLGMQACEANLIPKNTMSLQEYRQNIVVPAHKELQKMHEEIEPLYSNERALFMKLIMKNLTPNVLIGYSIQELLPPTHMLADGTIKAINPLFKICYFDRLVREAGTEFLRYYPSRFDGLLSYGPYQLTPIAFEDIQANHRLTKAFKKYENFDALKNIKDHVAVSAIFAYNNWERLSYLLQSDSTIHKLNEYFTDSSGDAEKNRKLQIFTAGITACMHHHPPKTNAMVRAYLNKTDDLSNIHYDCIETEGSRQLQKYYRSSAEAFLLMKVYHLLIESFESESYRN